MTTTITGNITRTPVASATKGGRRATPISQRTGQPIVRTRFGVVVRRQWRNPWSNDLEESSSLIEVSCRGVIAENAIAGLRQGDRVIVLGHIEQVKWESSTGQHSRLELLAEDVGLSLSKHQVNPPECAEEDEP